LYFAGIYSRPREAFTYNEAYANDQFREQIKTFEENKLAQATKAAEKVLEREKANRDMLRGNEVVKKDLMDTCQEHIDARGDITQDMIDDETEDDGFLHYLAGFTLPRANQLGRLRAKCSLEKSEKSGTF
jgi:hypothetical protein